jgi:hypothetical protein
VCACVYKTLHVSHTLGVSVSHHFTIVFSVRYVETEGMVDNQVWLPWIPGMFCVRCAHGLLSGLRLLEPNDPVSVCQPASDTLAHFRGHESPCIL